MAANPYTTYGVADGPSEAGLVRVVMEGEALAQPSEEEVSETIPAERFEHGRASLVAEPYPGTTRVWRGSESEANLLDESEWTVEGATLTIWELASDPVALVEWETIISRELTDADFSGGRAALMGEPSSVTLTEDGVTKTIAFSGDIGNTEQPLIRDPQYIDSADYVIMESTYGSRSPRGPRRSRTRRSR